MLGDMYFLAIGIACEPFMDLNNLFEVELFEVNVHSSYKEVNQVALLQFISPNAS